MIAHLFKMVWNRKRVNALILIEIFLSFIVLFAVAVTALFSWNNYRRPMGFDRENVWMARMSYPDNPMSENNAEGTLATLDQIQRTLRGKSAIEHFALADIAPYGNSTWTDSFEYKGKTVMTQMAHIQPDLFKALKMEIVHGRLFDKTDEALTRQPVVINKLMAEEMFGREDPLDQVIVGDDAEYKVRGVFVDYRKDGEFALPKPTMILPLVLDKSLKWPPENILMKMKAGTPLAFEEGLIKELEGVASGWSFRIQTMDKGRSESLRETFTFLITISLLAGFLLIMVTMGLVGVLWQNVTRRTSEMGVRRAKGATRKKIYAQILGEFLILTLFAIFLGLLVAVQVPIIGLFPQVGAGVLVSGFLAAMLIILLLTLFSSLYPSWLATTVNPAEALHYE